MHRILGVMLFITVVAGLFIVAFAQVPAQTLLKNAPSAADYPQAKAIYMLDGSVVTMNSDGVVSYVIHQTMRLFTHEGVKNYGEVQVPYDTDLQTLHLDYARTITPDGKVVIPEKSAIHEVTPPALEGAPMYSSVKLYTISMPALEPGAIIDYQVTLTDKEPAGTHETPDLSEIWTFAYEVPVQISSLVVQVPKTVHMRWQATGTTITPTVQTNSSTVTYTFLKHNIPAIGYEPYMPDIDALSPKLIFSTYSSWDQIATWYANLSADRIQTNSAIVAEVHTLTAGIQTPSEKISKIYDFVARKVRYVALEFGIGGYQPHPAAETFANRYGDCKDQATLLVTMLRAAGFEAYPVLVRVGNGIDADFSLLPTPQMFNHAIAAVRLNDKWMFLDPTCDICTTSYLPYSDRNRHVMIVLGKKSEPDMITTTYPFNPNETHVKSDVQAVLAPDGTLTATATVATGGEYDLGYRDLLLNYRPTDREKLFGQVLNMSVPGAQLTAFTYSDLTDTHTPVTLTEKFSKSGFAQAAAGMLLFAAPYPAQIPYPSYFSRAIGQEKRTYPLMNLPKLVEEHVTIAIPAKMSVQLPNDVHVTNAIGNFTAHYACATGKITVTRTLRVIKNEILPAEYPLFKAVIKAMLADANAMIVLKPAK